MQNCSCEGAFLAAVHRNLTIKRLSLACCPPTSPPLVPCPFTSIEELYFVQKGSSGAGKVKVGVVVLSGIVTSCLSYAGMGGSVYFLLLFGVSK